MTVRDLSEFRILDTPPTLYYLPNFITEAEEKSIISEIYNAPKPKWQQLSHRRLQNWGGIPHPKGMIAEPIPQWLMKYVNKVGELQLFGEKQPNHVLINEYLPGQGIMPHTDGPLFYPVITTINLSSHTVLDFYDMPSNLQESANENTCRSKKFSILLQPRSLLIVKDDMYSLHMHAIEEIAEDKITESIKNAENFSIGDVIERQTRLSVTIRHVPKTSKAKLFFTRR